SAEASMVVDERPWRGRCAAWSRFLSPVVAIGLTAGLTVHSSAQTVTGTIQGTVTDTTGATLPGSVVSIQNVETHASRELTTTERGQYAAPFLPLGQYKVTATLSGFGPVVRDAEVTLNATTVLDFTLDPTIRQEVTVVAQPPRINS